jgi:Holliday junction resolvasome RuvABC DNA-binding subunit
VEHLQRAIRLGDFAMLKSIRGVGEATAKRIVLELGKILVKEAQTAAAPPAEKKDAASAAAVPGAAAEDQLVDLAVRAVVELNQVTSDVAFRAVQRAYDELRAAGRSPAVQDLIKHSLPYAQ